MLANIPPLTLPDPPDCEAPALRPSHPLIALVARHDDHSPLLLRIRAPPIA